MRLIRFVDATSQPRYGLQVSDTTACPILQDPFSGPRPLSADPDALLLAAGDPEEFTQLLAPVEPRNVFCIGLNYRKHAEETGATIPKQPVLFMKPTTAVNDPGNPIHIPACCTHGPEVDYECELAVVIGTAGKNIAEANALDHVLGYTIGNDVSARRWQKHAGGGQWIRGKSFDGFCPLGPAIVTTDALPDPQGLQLTTTLNGQVMQNGHSSDMIFTIAQLVAFVSQDTTLQPGTVILTGTPSGVGVARNPQVFLKPGDELTATIEPIGALTNSIAAAK